MAPKKKHITPSLAVRLSQGELLNQCEAWGIEKGEKLAELDILQLRLALAQRCSDAKAWTRLVVGVGFNSHLGWPRHQNAWDLSVLVTLAASGGPETTYTSAGS